MPVKPYLAPEREPLCHEEHDHKPSCLHSLRAVHAAT